MDNGQMMGQVHNAEIAETAEQDSSARLSSALFTGVLGKVHNAELAEIFQALKITLFIQKHPSGF